MSTAGASIANPAVRLRLLVVVYALDTLTALAVLAYGNAAYLIDELDAVDVHGQRGVLGLALIAMPDGTKPRDARDQTDRRRGEDA